MNRQSLPLTRLTTGKGDRSSSSAMPTVRPTAWAIALATALVASSCSQAPPTDTAASPSPAASTTSATTTAPRTVPFNNPMVPGKGNVAGLPGVPRLQQFIPPTNPDTAATQAQADINKAKSTRDPFAVPIQIAPPAPGSSTKKSLDKDYIAIPPGINRTDTPKDDTPGPEFRGFTPPEIGDPPKFDVQKLLPKGFSVPNLAQGGQAPRGQAPTSLAQGGQPSRRTTDFVRPPTLVEPERPKAVAQVVRPPEPVEARQVKIAGVVQTDKDFKIIVQSPGESARYASVGDYIASGKVLIKRVALDSMYDPVVILEQFGQEVRKSVGEVTALSTSANANSTPTNSSR